MLNLLKFVDARMGEPSTWASLAAMLVVLHVSVDPGTLHVVSLWGTVVAGALGGVLSEVGTGKTTAQMVADAVNALLTAAKATPPAAATLLVIGTVAAALIPTRAWAGTVMLSLTPTPVAWLIVAVLAVALFWAAIAAFVSIFNGWPATKSFAILSAFAFTCLTACSAPQINTALSSPPGELFCSIQLAGGGSMVGGLVSAEASALLPGAAPIAVLATNSGVAAVNADCAKAAQSIAGGVSGVPVSPPPNPAAAAQIAIVAPASNTTATAAPPKS